MIIQALNLLGACSLHSRYLRFAVEHVNAFANGYIYKSYSIDDEAALALSFLSKNVNSKSIVIDAGANRGNFTRSLLKNENSIDKIIMIEPAPALFEILDSLEHNDSRIIFEPVAIGSTEDYLDLFFDSEGSSLGSLYYRDISHVGISMTKSTRVPVTTLDRLVQKHNVETIDYLKLDLEGHELEALKGARKIFDEQRIRALAFEFGGCNVDSRTFMKDFWQFLARDYGFAMYRLLPSRHLLCLKRYSERLEYHGWQNILACAPSVTPTWPILY